MTKLETQLKNKIMRRVYAVWILKKVLSIVFLQAAILFGFFVEFLREVSVISVIRNLAASSDILSDINYFFYAFVHTEITVQLYLLGIASIASWFITKETLKNLPIISLNKG